MNPFMGDAMMVLPVRLLLVISLMIMMIMMMMMGMDDRRHVLCRSVTK